MSTENNKHQFFDELSRIRDQDPIGGGLPLDLDQTIRNGKIPVQFYEPDATTSRFDYYYNARYNTLYKRLKVDDNRAVWKSVATI